MALGTAAAIGAGIGGLSGLLSGKKEGGSDAGNAFAGKNPFDYSNYGGNDKLIEQVYRSMNEGPGSSSVASLAINPATEQIQNNPILAQLFGQDGAMGRANSEDRRLTSQGYQLTPEDREAYGQASGDIARQFDQREGSLAQALSAKGLDASGAATNAFAGSQGNKGEQLAKLQTAIADKRMQNTMDRVNQNRNFLSQMGNQASQNIDQQFGRQLDYSNDSTNKAKMGMDMMSNQVNYDKLKQDQSNANFGQQQSSAHDSQFGNVLSGGLGGLMSGARLGGALSSSGPKVGTQAGSATLFSPSGNKYSNIA